MEFSQITNPKSIIQFDNSLDNRTVQNTINENVANTILDNLNIEAGKRYSLSFSFLPLSLYNESPYDSAWTQKFQLYLKDENQNSQFIQEFQVQKSISPHINSKLSFEINFSAYSNYQKIVFTAINVSETKRFRIYSLSLGELTNILESSSFNDKKVIKIGAYGSMGSSFFINLDEIKLGKSCFYETTADINNIYYLAVPQSSDIKIIDYLYIDE